MLPQQLKTGGHIIATTLLWIQYGCIDTKLYRYSYSRIDVDTIRLHRYHTVASISSYIDTSTAVSMPIRYGCIEIKLYQYSHIDGDTIQLHWYRAISIHPYWCPYDTTTSISSLMNQYRYVKLNSWILRKLDSRIDINMSLDSLIDIDVANSI
jgi:hypothetical protein